MVSASGRIYVVLLSGSVATGKTTLARGLNSSRGAKVLTTREAILRRLPNTSPSRADLQAAGEYLDKQTGGDWVGVEAADLIEQTASAAPIVVDAVMTHAQIDAVR